jgi:hypothetical protein
MVDEPLTYAKAGGPPDNWRGITVIDLETEQPVEAVVEVDTLAGFVIKHALDAAGNGVIDWNAPGGPAIILERIEGRFEIRRPA